MPTKLSALSLTLALLGGCATVGPGQEQGPVHAVDLVGSDASVVLVIRPDRYLPLLQRSGSLVKDLDLPPQVFGQTGRDPVSGELEEAVRMESLAGLILAKSGTFLSWWDASRPAAAGLMINVGGQQMGTLAAFASQSDFIAGVGHRLALPSGNPEALVGELRQLLKPYTVGGGEAVKIRELGRLWFSSQVVAGHVVLSFFQPMGLDSGPDVQGVKIGQFTRQWLSTGAVHQQLHPPLRDPALAVGITARLDGLQQTGELMGIHGAQEALRTVQPEYRGQLLNNAVPLLLGNRRLGSGKGEVESITLALLGDQAEVLRTAFRFSPYGAGLWQAAAAASRGPLLNPGSHELGSFELPLGKLVEAAEPSAWLGQVRSPGQLQQPIRNGGFWAFFSLLRAPVSLLAGLVRHPMAVAAAGRLGLQPMDVLPSRWAMVSHEGSRQPSAVVELSPGAASVFAALLGSWGKIQTELKSLDDGVHSLLFIGKKAGASVHAALRKETEGQNRVSAGYEKGSTSPRCLWRFQASAGAIEGGCALDDQALAGRLPLKLGPPVAKDNGATDALCRNGLPELLENMNHSAPDQIAQRVGEVQEVFKACSAGLELVEKAQWKNLVDAMVARVTGRGVMQDEL